MRIAMVATALCLSIVGISVAGPVDASIRRDTNIPAQPLASALEVFAKQRGLVLAYRSEVVGDRQSAGAVGVFTTDEALTQILSGTGLTYRYLDDKTLTIIPTGASALATTRSQVEGQGGTSAADKEGKKDSSGEFRVAQVDQTSAGPQVGQTQEGPSQRVELQEVIVTAQKRNERLQEVPVPVTAINASDLVEQNQLRLQDYFSSVPGLSLVLGDSGGGAPQLSIRGLSTGGGNPTVGITVDDVPYGSTTQLGGGLAVPDFDPSDLSQVEVLRGPQGTLYGASSIGGLLKFVTTDPTTEALSGHIQAGATGVHNAADVGYSFRGAVNVPLGDSFAIRASGFTRLDPGYIDNPLLKTDGVNQVRTSGGRLSGLWHISDAVSLKLAAMIQTMAGEGAPYAEAGLGDLQQTPPRGIGAFDRKFQVYSATLKAKLGEAELTSVSGYSVNHVVDSIDQTALFNEFGLPTQQVFGVPDTALLDNNSTRKFTQEIRLAAPLSSRLELLFGAFYTHEDTKYFQQIIAIDPFTGQSPGTWGTADFPTTYAETAAFADLTVRLTDRFDVQLGGRESWNRQTYQETDTGPLNTATNPEVETKDSSFTYLVTPRFKISPDLMAYVRLASGYRPGGPNASYAQFDLPPHFDPDKTQNYEIGSKSNFLDHRLSVDASAYYIDWKDLQLTVVGANGVGYFTNASRAKSQGFELSLEAQPLSGLKLSAWSVWNTAVLKEDFPPTSSVYGVAGDRLPYTSRFSANASAEQSLFVTNDFRAFFGGAVSYVGARQGVFNATPQRQNLPAYTQVDLRAGAELSTWVFTLFFNNVADRRGIIGYGTLNPAAIYYIQPRTIGGTITKKF